ncbi:MAG TPA: hypothetical protein VII51_08800 [Gaiellaceae bacterium]
MAARDAVSAQGPRGTIEPSVQIAFPAGEYIGVARLVAGGVATRLDFGFEAVDDLQLAIETVLRAAFAPAAQATMRIASDGGSLAVSIGPVDASALGRLLYGARGTEGIELGALLAQLVDGVAAQPEPVPSIVLRIDSAGRSA